MRHLVAIGVYSRTGELYSLVGVGEAMREGHAGNRGPLMLDLTSAVGRAHHAAVRLRESVRTGGPAYPLVHGRGFWDDLSLNAELGAGFDEVMGSGGDPGAVVGLHDWTGVRHVVDVGGGKGTTLAFLLRTNPDMRGTLVAARPRPASTAEVRGGRLVRPRHRGDEQLLRNAAGRRGRLLAVGDHSRLG